MAVNRKDLAGGLKKRLLPAAVLLLGILAGIKGCGAVPGGQGVVPSGVMLDGTEGGGSGGGTSRGAASGDGAVGGTSRGAASGDGAVGGTFRNGAAGSGGGVTQGTGMSGSIAAGIKSLIYEYFVPGLSFAAQGGRGAHWLLRGQIECLFPLYGYIAGQGFSDGEEETDFRTILLAEAEEGTYPWEEELGEMTGEGQVDPGTDPGTVPETNPAADGEAFEELLKAENEAAQQMQQMQQTPSSFSFLPHARQSQVDLGPLANYEALVQQFYTIDANTMAGSDQLNVEKFLSADMSISKEGEGPQILIYHTHSQETFADSVPGDSSTSIVGVGEYLTRILTEVYGYKVLHYEGQFDVEARDDAYSVALEDIERVLRENPSIQVVIDLHRDEMPETTRLVMDLDGRSTARFMFFNGLSSTKKTGNIAYLYNENLGSNLAFSFQMQLKAMEYYPGLTRKIYLKGYRYNMHLCPRSLLIELGAQNNTVQEAMNACEPLAHILDMVLSGQ